MTFEELANVWRSSTAADAPDHRDPTGELAAVRDRALALERVVRRRDRLETIGAIAVLPIFALFALRAGSPVARLGSAIVAIACVLIPVVLRLARGRRADPTVPVETFLRQELALVLRQRRLFLAVPWWYLGPLGLGVVLFFAGASPSPWLTAAYTAVVVAFYLALWRLNRRAVAREVDPRARELRLWISLVAGEETERDSPDVTREV